MNRKQVTRKKPPIYKKSKTAQDELVSYIVRIQKNVRGFIQRKQFQRILINQLLNEQEKSYRDQFLKIEAALSADPIFSSPEKTVLEGNSPGSALSFQRRWFSPSKNKRLVQPTLYDFDIYVTAAIEIQRVYRGFAARKSTSGGFYSLRGNIIRIQTIYRNWVMRKTGKIEVAAKSLAKQVNIITATFNSYDHLKSLVLAEDLTGKYRKLLKHNQIKLINSGVYSSSSKYQSLMNKYKRLKQTEIQETTKENQRISSFSKKNQELLVHYSKQVMDLKKHLTITQQLTNQIFSTLLATDSGYSSFA